jgi:hypothetical protein
LWIDAICTNQADEKEKFEQIRMMRDIYRNACMAWIWLGNEMEGTEDAIALITQLLGEKEEVWDWRSTEWLTGLHLSVFRHILRLSGRL